MAPARPATLAAAVFSVAAAILLPLAARGQRDSYRDAREEMVTAHIAAEGIDNPKVLEAMRTVPRHLFVRPELRGMAYYDQALDIGFKQTISPPFIVAYMTQVIDPQPTDRVLEIGTGSGYQAAILSGLVQDVYTIEIVEPLGRKSEALLKRLRLDNVHVRIGDGYQGWAEHAPFDKIIVTCSPENVPEPLVEQLKEGGRMIIPLGERYQQVFHLLEKKDGALVSQKLLPTLFVPMTGKSEALRQAKPDPRHPAIVNGGFEQDENGDGLADGWHYQRRSQIETTGAPEGKRFIRFDNQDSGRTAHILQGLGIDGASIGALTISLAIETSGIRPGVEPQEKPGLILHFFDGQRLPLGRQGIGPWTADTIGFETIREEVRVPEAAREMIVQIGLNGATGRLSLDNVMLTTRPR